MNTCTRRIGDNIPSINDDSGLARTCLTSACALDITLGFFIISDIAQVALIASSHRANILSRNLGIPMNSHLALSVSTYFGFSSPIPMQVGMLFMKMAFDF
nr:hypothetical protein Iba_chr13bCG13120 [Ipomoea batatas]